VLTHQRSWEAKAASACARARQLDPESIDAHLASGDLLRSAGQYDPALQEYDEALRRRPGDIDALLGRALVLGTIGRTEDAEGTCRQAIELHPEDWRGHSLMGWVHYVCGDHARALDAWRRVVVLTPDNARGRRNLGSALYRLNRFEDAAAAYRDSLAIQPSDEAYTNLGTVLYFMGRRMEAIEAFRKATDLAPANARWWGNLGNACRWVHGHEAKASEALNRAIDLMRERLERNPHDAEGWAHMAGWLANRGDMAAAGAAIRRALDLAPHNAECLARAGHVHFQLGDRASSMQCLEEALRHGYGVDELRHSVELAPLREDPEFARLISGTWSDVRRDVSVGNASTNPMSRGGRS
jgi:tetratricopeptide (TPR) repeat protein